ncbi:MAG: hypothetical protein A4E43_01378 [Methanosaeta sp. PtaB.Bin005]|nr:MAG: hypothetical protein A4E43_01378 [Methanosaeta sp. PtaB.Bin005]
MPPKARKSCAPSSNSVEMILTSAPLSSASLDRSDTISTSSSMVSGLEHFKQVPTGSDEPLLVWLSV